MANKTSDSRVIGLLVICLTLEIAVLLFHLGILSFTLNKSGEREGRAGRVAAMHNHLRRRGPNSLIWERSQIEEPLDYHDSILTLAQSTARLELMGNSEIVLSENTLVTLEPPDERTHGEIRLRFVKGNFEARNPFQSARITGSAWTVDLRPGSQAEFRQVVDGEVEVRVKGGQALVQTDRGTETVDSNAVLRIGREATVKLNVDRNLAWVDPPPVRVYVQSDRAKVRFRWSGRAEKLVTQTLGAQEEETDIHEISGVTGSETSLDLGIGQHRIFLRRSHFTSTALNVEVWRAPFFHLLQPLPRNRLRVGEMNEFMWTRVSGFDRFELTLWNDDSQRVAAKTDANHASVRFSEPGDLRWKVRAFDRDGFATEPSYSYPLFIRHDPMAAPVLKSPRIRRPARTDQSARPSPLRRLWDLLVPRAHADDEIESVDADFEWEPVAGSDRYVIEISRTPDFRDPVVARAVSGTRFRWRGFAPGEYYWRVASGQSSGRLGTFSEPQRVDLSIPVSEPSPVPAPRTESATSSPPVKEEPPPFAEAEPVREPEITPRRSVLGWSPRFFANSIVAPGRLRVRWSGAVPSGIAFDGFVGHWRLGLWYSQSNLNPNPRSEFPFQGSLAWREAGVTAIRFKRRWGLGGMAFESTSVKRSGSEAVRAHPELSAGPAAAIDSRAGAWHFLSIGAVIASGHGAGLSVGQSARIDLGSRISLGVGATAVFHGDGSSIFGAHALVGVQF